MMIKNKRRPKALSIAIPIVALAFLSGCSSKHNPDDGSAGQAAQNWYYSHPDEMKAKLQECGIIRSILDSHCNEASLARLQRQSLQVD